MAAVVWSVYNSLLECFWVNFAWNNCAFAFIRFSPSLNGPSNFYTNPKVHTHSVSNKYTNQQICEFTEIMKKHNHLTNRLEILNEFIWKFAARFNEKGPFFMFCFGICIEAQEGGGNFLHFVLLEFSVSASTFYLFFSIYKVIVSLFDVVLLVNVNSFDDTHCVLFALILDIPLSFRQQTTMKALFLPHITSQRNQKKKFLNLIHICFGFIFSSLPCAVMSLEYANAVQLWHTQYNGIQSSVCKYWSWHEFFCINVEVSAKFKIG